MGAFRTGWRRTGVLIGAIGLLTGAVASPASAHGGGANYYTVTITGAVSGDVNAGDSDAQLTITIKNLSKSQRLNSANITVPSPFSLVGAPGDTVTGNQVIELRGLNLAKDATKTVVATVEVRTCTAAAPVTFPTVAKKTADYSGSSVFTLKAPYDIQVGAVGTCGLAFAAQPTDAEKNVAITSNFGAAPPISVRVVDAGGVDTATFSTAPITLTATNTVAFTLGGTTSANAVSGVASFSPGPTLNTSASGYRLTAASTGLTSSPASIPFAIADDLAPCGVNQACSATAAKSGVTATASFPGGGTATNLAVTVGGADAPNFECNNYPKGSSQVSQFSFTGDGGTDRTGTFSVTIPNASWFVILYQVCWASPVDFITKSGKLASAVHDVGDGTLKPGTNQTLKVGLLPNCKKWWWNDHWDWDDHWDFPNPTIETLPCVSSRSYNWSTRSVTIEVKATGADPWRY